MSVFPFLAMPEAQPQTAQSLPLYEEWAFDFDAGRMAVTDGRSYRVTGLDAVKVWMYKAVCTAKGRFRAYSPAFGSELESLIGSSYSLAAARAEAQRMVTEALLVSPYITAVDGVEADLAGSELTVRCSVVTIYGGASLEVVV